MPLPSSFLILPLILYYVFSWFLLHTKCHHSDLKNDFNNVKSQTVNFSPFKSHHRLNSMTHCDDQSLEGTLIPLSPCFPSHTSFLSSITWFVKCSHLIDPTMTSLYQSILWRLNRELHTCLWIQRKKTTQHTSTIGLPYLPFPHLWTQPQTKNNKILPMIPSFHMCGFNLRLKIT